MPRHIVIVGSRAWRPKLHQDFLGLEPRQKELAGAVVRYMHDRHVGVTPELAAGLARALGDDPRQRAESGVWRLVFERLEDQFTQGDRSQHGDRSPRRGRYTGMVPSAAPFYAVARIATPLVAWAGERLERVFLFAADPEPAPPDFAQRYQQYSKQLARHLTSLAGSEEISEVFWTDRAFSLSRLSSATPSRAMRREEPAATTPDVDTVALGHLLRLEPHRGDRPSLGRSMPRRLTASPRFRPLLNRNEGGIDGLVQTRRLADLPSMLQSELTHPPPLLLERILRSGYLALRRPPLREKQRDVMIAGILPPSVVPSAAASATAAPAWRDGLVKAAWLDAMMRLSLSLRRLGLRRSEFLWTDGVDGGRHRTSRCRIDELPLDDAVEPERAGRSTEPVEPTPAERKRFLAALGWLPESLDRHAAGSWPAASATAGPIEWAASVWKGLRTSGGPKASLDPRVYDTLHLMLFLPRRLEPTTSFGTLRHTFGLPVEPGYTVSVTWMPELTTDAGTDSGWAVSAERRPTLPMLRQAAVDASFENRLAGALVDAWLRTIHQELLRAD